MTNKKRANKLAKITVASAIALSALAQPLGNVITVKAAEAPVTTKAESKLLQSNSLKASVPVTFKNAQFTSTDTSIPDWYTISTDEPVFNGTPYSLGTKQSDGYFKVNGSSYTGINPTGQGSFFVRLASTAGSTYRLCQAIDTVPGVSYTIGINGEGISGAAGTDILQSIHLLKQDADGSSSARLSGITSIFMGLKRNVGGSFVATSNKTIIALSFDTANASISSSVVKYSDLSIEASGTESIATPTISTVTDNDTVVSGTGTVGQTVRVGLPDGTIKTGKVGNDGKYSIEIPKQAKDKVIKVMLYDGLGNISPEASTTVVADTVAPPTINTVTSDDTTVKGTGINGATVTLTIGGTNYTGTVSNGEYSITIPKQSAGAVISATESLNSKTSTSVNTTVTQGSVAAPTINGVKSNDTTVKGTGIAGASVTVTIAGQDRTATVGQDGNYSVTIPAQAVGTVITAKQTLNGKTSNPVSTTVTQGTVADPTINPVTTDNTSVKGTGINGATVTITIGSNTYTGTVSGGEYTITIPKQAAGTVISAKQSLNSQTSNSVNTTVTQGELAAPVINTVTSDDIRVTGTGTKGAVVTLTIAGHDYTGLVDANGAYSITIVKQPAGTTITAKQEINGKSSANATTTVTQGVVTPPTVNPITTDDIKVTGTGMKGAVVKLTINGTDYTGLVDSDGKYSIDIPKQAEGTGIVAVEIINGTTSTTTIASVTQGTVATPTINSVTTEDTTVKGTGTTGAVVTITIGSNTYTGSVTNGSYSITIPKQAAGTVISAKQTLNNKTSAAATTSVVATQTTLTTNNFTIGVDNYIRGTYTGSSVAKLAIEVNGTVQQKITATGSPYQYYAKGKITAGTDQVYVISYNANGDQLKRVKVDVKTLTSGTITPATFYIGTDNYLTGTLTGDISKFSLTVNGVETTKINVTTAPTFRYYANNLIRNLTDVVTVNGYDSAGKLLDSKPVTVDKNRGNQGAIATVAPFTLGKDSYVTGTYTGDIAKVELQVNNVALQRINVASDGTIKYYAKGKINALTDVVKLVGYDSTGIAVSTKVITVANANGGITVNPYVIGTDGYVKGTYTGSVAKISLTVNGDKKTTISVPVPGPNYQYYAKSLITSASDVVIVTAYNAAGGVLDTQTVSVSSR
ncbi:hypothetical protein HCA99_16345 [Listeria booriae]|uniref:immunoglobulin-like domain-containing protein n=1 Tax=Listeria booriae TaxID=1552123 RepID=UPI001627461A|nr:immunoglobulin-like domain-containing protein [Listeria booriae]MBC2080803.1 hypothetical protein [Listeria booriae]